MAKQQTPDTPPNPTPTGGEPLQPRTGSLVMASREHREGVTATAAQQAPVVSCAAPADEETARCAASPELVSEETRHQSPVVVAAALIARSGPDGDMETDDEKRDDGRRVEGAAGNRTVGSSVSDTKIEKNSSSNRNDNNSNGGGDAVPVSPPSSPAYVDTRHEPSADGMKEMARTGSESEPLDVKDEVGSPSGGGGPAPTTPPTEVLSTPSPSPAEPSAAAAATVASPTAVVATDAAGLKSDESIRDLSTTANSDSVVGIVDGEPKTTSASVPTAAVPRPPPPIKLGRGRKLCPNCHALTKSAVKQCRECNHVFSPASSRLRPSSRTAPKVVEEVTISSRRRLRPSQRLIEYECEAVGPSSSSSAAGSAGGAAQVAGDTDGAAAAATVAEPQLLLPTNAANGGGGGANLIAASGGGGGGRPAAVSGAGGMTKTSTPTGPGGSGAKSARDSAGAPPKRSHKRKVSCRP